METYAASLVLTVGLASDQKSQLEIQGSTPGLEVIHLVDLILGRVFVLQIALWMYLGPVHSIQRVCASKPH